MNVRKGIYLVGLAGSGKTTLGKQLADHLQCKFIDLDHEIERRQGKSISDIFNSQGEGNFRIMEREALHEIAGEQGSFVMATGGGTPCYHFNMDTMNDHGVTIYLDVSPGDLAIRVMDAGVENRPIFKSYDHQDLIQEIRDMKEIRDEFYHQAQIKIKDNQITTQMIVSHLESSGYFKKLKPTESLA